MEGEMSFITCQTNVGDETHLAAMTEVVGSTGLAPRVESFFTSNALVKEAVEDIAVGNRVRLAVSITPEMKRVATQATISLRVEGSAIRHRVIDTKFVLVFQILRIRTRLAGIGKGVIS